VDKDQRRSLVSDHEGLAKSEALALGRRFPAVDARDLHQAALEGLCRAAQTYDPSVGAFSTYAFYWVRKLLWREVRAARTVSLPERCYLHGAEDEEPWVPAPESVESLPDDSGGAPEDFLDLREALRCLPVDLRTAVRLYGEGVSFQEIGRELGVSTTTAFRLYRAAIQRLRKCLR